MRLAIVGDVHQFWDERDSRALDALGYDLVLLVGDLAGYGVNSALPVARAIAQLRTEALVLPGNHDGVTVTQLVAEVFSAPEPLCAALGLRMGARVQQLRRTLEPAILCGYSLHRFNAHKVTIVAARPHSMGGPRLAFRRYLVRTFGVRSMHDSTESLCALFSAVPADHRIIVLAHCGPSGLGSTRNSIYGCDFRPEEGDWGDPDLAAALTYARKRGCQILGVVAGHMHHAVRGGGTRAWQVRNEGLLHVNAARVPRVRPGAEGEERHHVCLRIEGVELVAEPVWLPAPGVGSRPPAGQVKKRLYRMLVRLLRQVRGR